MMTADRKVLAGLQAMAYEHPLDSSALASLQGVFGLKVALRKFNEYGLDRILRIQYMGSNIRIDGHTFPEIRDLVEEAGSILGLSQLPDVYVQAGIEINASTAGVEHPLIVLNSACIDCLSPDELLFVIGHELGHIKSQHVLYRQVGEAMPIIAEVVGSITLGLTDVIYAALETAFLNWMRSSELTADRAGLLACQDINVANSTLAKIAGLPTKFYDRFNADDFVAQARTFERYDASALDRIAKYMSIMGESHPWTIMRTAELQGWATSGGYAQVMESSRAAAEPLTGGRCAVCHGRVAEGDMFCSGCGSPQSRVDSSA